MKKVLTLGIALNALLSLSAFAADASDDIGMETTAGKVCVIKPITQLSNTVTPSNATLTPQVVGSGSTPSSNAKVTFNVANSTTAMFIPGATIALKMSGYCNSAHKFNIESVGGGLRNPNYTIASGSAAFIRHLNYKAELEWGAATAAVTTAGSNIKSSDQNVGTALNSDGVITLTVRNPQDLTQPLINGTFADTLKVSLLPNL